MMINEKFINHVLTLLATAVFLFACYKAKAQDLSIVSGTVYQNRVELIYDLPVGDYFMVIRHIDGKFWNVPFSNDGTGTKRKTFDNMGNCSFAIAILMNDKGEIIWRRSLGKDNDCD